MAHEEPPIDWDDVRVASREGRLIEILEKLPCVHWAERKKDGITLLHYAGVGANVAAAITLIMSGLLDVSARNLAGYTPAHFAATSGQPRALEVLCAAGADLWARDVYGLTLIDGALPSCANDDHACVLVLLSNGVRLSTVSEHFRDRITPELVAFERGVLRCHAVAVALLGLKRRRKALMWGVDRWIVRELCFAVWATRTDKSWRY